MPSTLPTPIEATGPGRPLKTLTAGFNSPVPACTLQISTVTPAGRKEPRPGQQTKQRVPLTQRSWFDRLLAIF